MKEKENMKDRKKQKDDSQGIEWETMQEEDLNRDSLLAWWIFYKSDSVPSVDETPEMIYDWIKEFNDNGFTAINKILGREYGKREQVKKGKKKKGIPFDNPINQQEE